MKPYIPLILFILLFSCSKEKDITPIENTPTATVSGPFNPTYITPPSFPSLPTMNNPSFNLMSTEGVKLGKKMYYDNILSNNGLSCSSCHISQYSYSTPAMGPLGTAVLTHQNVGWNDSFGWYAEEGYVLDEVALADLAEGNAFLNTNNDSLTNRLIRSQEYQQLFWEAFGIKIIELSVNDRNKYISYALAQFIRTMVSKDAKFDRYLRGEIALTASEINGYDIFMDGNKGDCFHCHGSAANPLWSDRLFHNNALDSTFTGYNLGRYLITNNTYDIGKFRTPTLRNIELTAPYMHDNRFSTLEEVINFYSEGLKNSPYVDPLMQKIGQGGVQLTPSDKLDLIAFLKTLTDTTFVNNPNFQ